MSIKKILFYLFIALPFVFFSCKSRKESALSTPPKTYSSKGPSEKQKMDFTYLFFNASKEKMLGNYDMAASLYSQCSRIDPEKAAPYYEAANIYNAQGAYKIAMENAKKAVDIDPKNTWYNVLLADCYIKLKKYNEAVNVYQNILKIEPERVDFYYELSSAQLLAGKDDDAIRTLEKIEGIIGTNEEISLQKLRIYRGVENFDKSEKELKKLIEIYPTEPKFYGMLGELYQQKGMKEKAFETYNKLLQLDPENPFVHLSLADYYRSNKEDAKSYQEIKLAFKNSNLDIDSKVKILLSYFAVTEIHSDLKEEALELCRILVEVHPKEAKAYSIYGDFLYRDKKLEEARTSFRKAIELDKSKYALWNQLLIIDSELEDYKSMVKESEEAIELFPNQPFAYLLNGLANIQLKNYTAAIETLNQGKLFVVENPSMLSQFYANLGDAFYRQKKHKESDHAYERALEVEPDNIYVLNNYAYYLSLRNEKLSRAEEMSKRTNQLQPNNNSYQDTYGWILYQMGKFDEAEKWLQKALMNGGKNNSVILEHYGDVLFKLGNTEKAIEYWNEAKQKGNGSDLLDKKINDKKLVE